MNRLHILLIGCFALDAGCGGGGTNVLNGLVSTSVISDVGNDVPANNKNDSTVLEKQTSPVFAVSITALESVEMRIESLTYFIEDSCQGFTAPQHEAPKKDDREIRIAGPFMLTLTDGSITPDIPDVEVEFGREICGALVLPQKPMPGDPLPLEIRGGQPGGCQDAEIRLESPPEMYFETDAIVVDDDIVAVELEFPVSLWLEQISKIADEQALDCDDLVIEPDRHSGAHDDINQGLPGQGEMRRRPR